MSDDAKLASLAKANAVLAEHISRDSSQIPDPGEAILGASSSSAYVTPPWALFDLKRTLMIPEELFSSYESTKSTCHMGIFSQIDRAWITLNNKLFLWDYIAPKDSLQSFPEQPGNIHNVGLINPKPGIFIDTIKHLLVLCTTSTLIVLGLAAQEGPADRSLSSQQFVIYDTELRFPTDNVAMSSIVSTLSGRAFMCGISDGNLYELRYQAREGWFGSKSSLYNHSASGVSSVLPSLFSSSPSEMIAHLALDDSRDLLYALTSSSTINLYNVSGQTTTPLQRIAVASNIFKHAQLLCPPLGTTKLDIIDIHAFSTLDSFSIHLMAVTSSGVRLFFSALRRNFSNYGTSTSVVSGVPSTLELVHVRMAPTTVEHPRTSHFDQSPLYRGPSNPSLSHSKSSQLSNLSCTSYFGGLFLGAQSPSDGSQPDVLFCTSPDLPRIGNLAIDGTSQNSQMTGTITAYSQSSQPPRPPFGEYASLLELPGKTWAIAHLKTPQMPPFAKGSIPSWNDLITQFTAYPDQFLLLTNDGLSVIVKKRPVDSLRELIESTRRGGDEELLRSFLDQYGRNQTCAMLLALASANSFVGAALSLPVPFSSAISLHITPSQSAVANPTGSESIIDEATQNAAKTLFYDWGQQPTEFPNSLAVAFSGRHEGLALYFSRLVRPIWKSKITRGTTSNQTTNIPVVVLSSVQRNLQSLADFLDRNPQLFLPPGDYSSFGTGSGVGRQGPWKEEQTSASSLRELLGITIEAINFILLLIDYKLPDTIALCEPPLQQKLYSMTWEDLLTTKEGRDVGKGLVTALINQQIGQQISIDTISDVLQSRCPNFCSTDDVMTYKAVEALRRAKEAPSAGETAESLRESLRLFLKSTRNLHPSNLAEICADYQQMRFPEGGEFWGERTVQLPLKCANDWDIDRSGIQYWAGGHHEGDGAKQAYEMRIGCYDLVLKGLKSFDDRLDQATSDDEAQHAEVFQSAAYHAALESDDPVFHSHLYNWFISHGRTEELLQIRTPFIEGHLLREPHTREKSELLWQLYVGHGEFLRAAEALASLAEANFPMTLDKRVEYLSLAIGNAKSHQASIYDRQEQGMVEFLNDLEEKLEVANLQLEMLGVMRTLQGLDDAGRRDVNTLASRLMDVSELYGEYAERYNLNDMKLLIIKVSDHRDPQLVASIWRGILHEAEEEQTDIPVILAERVRRLGLKLYPSESAFPCDLLCELLEDFSWEHRNEVAVGWVPQVLVESGVPYDAIFRPLYTMRESGSDGQQPPYHAADRELYLIQDITYLVKNWLTETIRPASRVPRGSFPANVVDQMISAYLEVLSADAASQDLRRILADIQRKIRSRF
ncbi:Non-repetitive/WGA-negative nucleoporin C-terminal-domain-containing protein [Cantharellus anzutake]|uniref:Non-repetitive/WGA-negative nucleoporin C-terminal-domain-containing protein n=1 Tax=Cantharellus anzutake TaxID=1750568 RepID=UPI001905BF0D|nr:Non-repetitive/WGA-negative nucleoporin C-terminal-domain-containing protein [Cantharellus anzutake]KAF8328804.1 Non-repetitive/WGA-negative nucleoporin C-terminal-domain-containing protein [Cantharellus anzutake]